MIIIAIIVVIIMGVLFTGCGGKPKPKPPDEPEIPKWEDYYPEGFKIPSIDLYNKWQTRNFDSIYWANYENEVRSIGALEGRQDKYDDYTLAMILTHKLPDGRYLFKWTDDMEIWGKVDHWGSPDEFLIRKDENGNPDPDGLFRDDCDGFAGFHCDYLYRLCNNNFLVWWLEIYWKRRFINKLNGSYYWKDLGHAITIYKRSPESNWRCFSNQQWLGMTDGIADIMDIVHKFVPLDKEEFKEQYEMVAIKARHPVTGKMLWELN